MGEDLPRTLAELGLAGVWDGLRTRERVRTVHTDWTQADGPGTDDGLRPAAERWALDRGELEHRLAEAVPPGPGPGRDPVETARPHASTGFTVDATGRAAAFARRRGARSVVVARLLGMPYRTDAEAARSPAVNAFAGGWSFACVAGALASRTFFTDAETLRGEELPIVAEGPRNGRRPRVIDASSRFLEPSCAGNWAAVGDAALTRDPLASDGLGFAARSGLLVAGCWSLSGFDQERYAGALANEVATYRIARHRLYLAAAERFGSPFWLRQARLALATRRPN